MSKLSGYVGRTRTTTEQPGYNGNIMAEHGSALWSKNLADLAVENEPRPDWINDDVHVAAGSRSKTWPRSNASARV